MTYNLYADVIFFNNFAMDFFLLIMLRKILKFRKRRGGLLIASLLGAFYAVAVTIFPIPIVLFQTVLTYAGVSAFMVFAAFRIKGWRDLVKGVIGLYLSVVIMAGLMQLLNVSGGISWYLEQMIAGGSWKELPFLVYVTAAGGCFFLACFMWQTAKLTEQRNGHLYTVVLFYRGKSKSMTGFLDTGNRLTEPYSKRPVSIVSGGCCEELFEAAEEFLFIPFRTVGREDGVLPAVTADRMELEIEEQKIVIEAPCIAISKEPLSGNNDYEMLINEAALL